MPLYKNNSTERKTLNGQAVDPGEVFSTQMFISPLPSGVTKLADAPMFNPIILAQEVTSNTTIAVPTGISKFNIHLYVKTGTPTIFFNSASNTPGLLLYEGAKWNVQCFGRSIDSIIFTNMGTMYIIIERM